MVFGGEIWEAEAFPSGSFFAVFFFLAADAGFFGEFAALFVPLLGSNGFFLVELAFFLEFLFAGSLDGLLFADVGFLTLGFEFGAFEVLFREFDRGWGRGCFRFGNLSGH